MVVVDCNVKAAFIRRNLLNLYFCPIVTANQLFKESDRGLGVQLVASGSVI